MNRAAYFPLSLLLGTAVSASAQCVVANRPDGMPSFGDFVQLRNVNIPSNQMGSVRAGYGAWNDCPGASAAFPTFLENYQVGTGLVVDLRQVDGINSANPASCGFYDATRGEVVLFEIARNGTQVVQCLRADIFTDTITHELGHILGLANASLTNTGCNTYIMGPMGFTGSGTYVNRSLQNEECQKVNDIQYTPFEQLLDLCTGGDQNACNALGPCEYPDSCNGSPIVLDLAGDGFSFTALKNGVKFDIDGDGWKERTSWTAADSDESFLFLDRNRNGKVDGASELFGNSTPLLSGETANNGFQALFELDLRTGGNHNGYIDPGDDVYRRLRLWRDRNQDGKSTAAELTSLSEAGVTAIEVTYRVRAQRDGNNNWLRFLSAAYRGGRRIEAVDVFFIYEVDD